MTKMKAVGAHPKAIFRSSATLLVASFILIALGLYVLWPSEKPLPLDPMNPKAEGSQALARVLARQDVDLTIVRTKKDLEKQLSKQENVTVVISDNRVGIGEGVPELLVSKKVRRSVVLAPTDEVLGQLKTDMAILSEGMAVADPPSHCNNLLGKARTVSKVGLMYTPMGVMPQGSFQCMSQPGGAQVVLLPRTKDHPETLLLVSASWFVNGSITEDDNAAAALAALSPTQNVVWYSPSESNTAATGGIGFTTRDLLPNWVQPMMILLAWVFLLFAFWRGRRFGRLATEPLPVVVKASETTQSLGRMYAQACEPEPMIAALQEQLRPRLARALYLPSSAGQQALVSALARRSGRKEQELLYLLYGSPTTESEMVSMARGLTALEQEVIRERK